MDGCNVVLRTRFAGWQPSEGVNSGRLGNLPGIEPCLLLRSWSPIAFGWQPKLLLYQVPQRTQRVNGGRDPRVTLGQNITGDQDRRP